MDPSALIFGLALGFVLGYLWARRRRDVLPPAPVETKDESPESSPPPPSPDPRPVELRTGLKMSKR